MSQGPRGVYSTQGAASNAAGMGPGRKAPQKRLWLVSEHDENYVEVQPINKNLVPVGQKRLITVYEFENEYHKEPQFVVEGGGANVRPVWKAPRPMPPERDELQDFPPREKSTPRKQPDDAGASAGVPEQEASQPQEELRIPSFESGSAQNVDLDDEPFDDAFLEEFLASSMGAGDAGGLGMPQFDAGGVLRQDSVTASPDAAEPQLLTEPIYEPPRTPKERQQPEPAAKPQPRPEPARGPESRARARIDLEEIERVEREARSTFGLGLSHLKRGNKDRARVLFEDVAAMEGDFEPQHKHMFNEFGINLRKSGMPDVALLHYNRAAEISPNDENLHHNLARIYYELGDTQNCERELQKSLELNPELQYAQKFLRHVQRKGRKKRGLFQGLLPLKGVRRK